MIARLGGAVLEANATIAGKYRLDTKLGQGGMGSVWVAHHLALDSKVAVKLIDPTVALNPDFLARFMREARSAAALRSPHVIQIFDYGVDEGVPYIVMELLEGESLGSRLERERLLSPELTAAIVTQIARAVARAHDAKIVHRDLKPDNVFLVVNDEEVVAKVLDFGIAKAGSEGFGQASSSTRTGALLGSPYYMSPEQAHGSKTVDHRSDLWAMGVIAFECLTGRRPFDGTALGELLLKISVEPIPVPSQVASVPAGFDEWFARSCERDPEKRFQSAKELARDLRAVLTPNDNRMTASFGERRPSATGPEEVVFANSRLGSTTAASSMSTVEAPSTRQPKFLLAAMGVALAVGAGVIAFVASSRSKPEPTIEGVVAVQGAVVPGVAAPVPQASSVSPVVVTNPVQTSIPADTAKGSAESPPSPSAGAPAASAAATTVKPMARTPRAVSKQKSAPNPSAQTPTFNPLKQRF
jgi:serine/threonine-protein kinase